MPFNTALSGLQAASGELRVVGNNVANASTIGFKQSRVEFSDVYASSALGSVSTAIGSGVRLAAVKQQHTQGNLEFTDNSLDLAISGQGFFVLSDGGAQVFSRAGSFGVNSSSQIVNAQGHTLQGYQADNDGNITGTVGNLTITTSNIAPAATTTVTADLNLDAASTAPTSPFVGYFSSSTTPATTTYNSTTSTTVYDSLGVSHEVSLYFIKTSVENQWQMHVGLDGTAVTTPSPMTLMFTNQGVFIPNDGTASTVTTQASLASNPGNLITSGTMGTLTTGDLTINGTAISVPLTDGVSTTDATDSAMALATAINLTTATHGATASASTSVNLGAYTTGGGVFATGEFVVNGTSIIPAGDSAAQVVAAIDALANISATLNASSEIVVTAANGMNIQLASSGAYGSTGGFANFDVDAVLDQVQRGTVTLSSNSAITVRGDSPSTAGFSANSAYPVLSQTSSDLLTISNWSPGGGAATQNLTIDLTDTTQFGSSFAVQSLTVDGYTTGQPTNISVEAGGQVFARFSNGQSKALGQVVLGNFANSEGLQALGDTSWSESFASGTATLGAPQTASFGAITSGALEGSNVSLTKELVKLIVAQRNFQASAQTIRTADTVTQTIINIR